MPADRFTMEHFTDFVRAQEGGEKHREADGRWMPFKDPTGLWHIGRGHLINGGKSPAGYEKGLRDAQVEALFRQDLNTAVEKAQRAVGEDEWRRLDPRRKFMLSDFAFNLGGRFHEKFPKFTKGVLNNDPAVMKRESKRFYKHTSGEMRELKTRNDAFAEFFDLEDPGIQVAAETQPTTTRYGS